MAPRPFPPGPSTFAAMGGMGGGGGLHRVPAFLEGLSQTYGPIASWQMIRGRFWFVDDAGLIETVMTASGYDVVKGRGLQRMRRLLGLGLLTSDEPMHLKQRRLVPPAFHRDRVAGYAAGMIDAARSTAEGLHDGETVAIDRVMNRLALRIAAATLFSADVDDDADTTGAAGKKGFRAFPAVLPAFTGR